ncbi:hypothetical protein HJG60_008787 [Phyllostomus discolor]|uniref:Uncharacterized protein n=1 Tax=Phyllostomus discolor TaxID=89673 RepID=A0A833YM67_9CHIR|nr:hypothetical protein HJG60_008787 [Phyllostomus discolor]
MARDLETTGEWSSQARGGPWERPHATTACCPGSPRPRPQVLQGTSGRPLLGGTPTPWLQPEQREGELAVRASMEEAGDRPPPRPGLPTMTEEWVSMRTLGCCEKAGWLLESPQPTSAPCRHYCVNVGEGRRSSARQERGYAAWRRRAAWVSSKLRPLRAGRARGAVPTPARTSPRCLSGCPELGVQRPDPTQTPAGRGQARGQS